MDEYISIYPNIEIFEYGTGDKKQIVMSPDSIYRIQHSDKLKMKYDINESALAILLLLDGSRTIDDVRQVLFFRYQDSPNIINKAIEEFLI